MVLNVVDHKAMKELYLGKKKDGQYLQTIVTPHAAEQIQQQTYASINRRHRSNSASSLPKQEPASQRTYTFEDRG